jgi:hypothetical protein
LNQRTEFVRKTNRVAKLRPSPDRLGANLKAREHRSIRRGTCLRVLRFFPELSSAFPPSVHCNAPEILLRHIVPEHEKIDSPPALSRYHAGHAAAGSPPPSLF